MEVWYFGWHGWDVDLVFRYNLSYSEQEEEELKNVEKEEELYDVKETGEQESKP